MIPSTPYNLTIIFCADQGRGSAPCQTCRWSNQNLTGSRTQGLWSRGVFEGDSDLTIHWALTNRRVVIELLLFHPWQPGSQACQCCEYLQVAFEKVGAVSTQTITKQRKKEQPAVQAELERQIRRLKSIKEATFLTRKWILTSRKGFHYLTCKICWSLHLGSPR